MTPANSQPNLKRVLRSTLAWSLLVIFIFFGVFGSWLASAPLSSAAVATGIVSPDGSRKAIQHLEGGIINEILVRDGDDVKAGQVLVTIADIQAKAQYTGIKIQWLRLRAIRQRTKSLQLDEKELLFPDDVRAHAERDKDFADFLNAQVDLFRTRRGTHIGHKKILRRQVKQIKEEITGLTAELSGNTQQLSYLKEELVGLRKLLETGDAKKSRILQLQRAEAEIESKIAAAKASIASASQKIDSKEIEIANTETAYRDKLSDEYMRINGEIAQLEERKGATQDILKRTAVIAPIDGIVVGLRFKTTGGVIKPGDVILELVPSQGKLIIDTRVQPIDINSVRVGQRAQVHLLPFEQRHMPIIEGDVVSVSADAMADDRTGERYYEAKVIIPNERLKSVAPDVTLSPGMPADVMIVTGERSALRYLLEPIERSFRRSFRQG